MVKAASQQTGGRKAAILALALGSDAASKVLKYFNDSEIERVSMEIANTTMVETNEMESTLEEFLALCEARRFIIDGGIDSAKDVLEKTLGPQKASEIMKRLRETSKVKPFMFLRNVDPSQMVNMLNQEHPQTIALILSYLDPEQSSLVLSSLPEQVQSDIARRIALMERTSPDILRGVERVLRERMSSMFMQDFTATGGIPSVVDILNRVDRGTEKLILEELEKEDAELAEEIRNQMFIFEDVITLDDASIQRVARELETRDLALALKGASEEVAARMMKNISKRAAEMLKEDMEFMGPVRLREVEEAQQKIVALIRRLDEAGEIILSRGGDDAVVV